MANTTIEMLNPTGAMFNNRLPQKKTTKYDVFDTLEDITRYSLGINYGTYYPTKCAPGYYVDNYAEVPVIMPAGNIVSIRSILPKELYSGSGDTVAGVDTNGNIATAVNVETGAVMKKPVDFLYGKDVAGLFVKANGGVEAKDKYSQIDVDNYIFSAAGAIPTAGVTEYTRAANKPAGIVASRVFADIRFSYVNYSIVDHGYSIIPAGVLSLPVVVVIADSKDNNLTTAIPNTIAAIKGAVDGKHQYVILQADTKALAIEKFVSGLALQSDRDGKFTEFTSSDADQKFGKILSVRSRLPQTLEAYQDSFPGSQITGMDTGGLSKRLFTFMKSAMLATGVSSSSALPGTITAALGTPVNTSTNGISLLFANADVEFGNIVR